MCNFLHIFFIFSLVDLITTFVEITAKMVLKHVCDVRLETHDKIKLKLFSVFVIYLFC